MHPDLRGAVDTLPCSLPGAIRGHGKTCKARCHPPALFYLVFQTHRQVVEDFRIQVVLLPYAEA